MDTSKWNAEDRRLVTIINETEAKLAQTRADREKNPHLAAVCDKWIAKYESQLVEMRAQLEMAKSLYV